MGVGGPYGDAFLALLGLLSQLFLRGSRVTRDLGEARKQRTVERRFWIGLQDALEAARGAVVALLGLLGFKLT